VLFSAESYGLAAEAYSDALEGCKKTAKQVEEKFVAKMHEANVCSLYVYTMPPPKKKNSHLSFCNISDFCLRF